MKPAFALSLSFDGISLLHRCAGGWRNAGDVALDAADLTAALAGLRGAASRLDPGPLRTKLILPNDQIRYLTVETGAADDTMRDIMVRDALEGATPYAVEELAYDISVDDTVTHVAAVARETLDEAEAFALEHDFGPLCFVAIPGRKPFLGEPFFGTTRHAGDILPAGEQVEPDGVAVVVVGPAEFPVDGVPPAAATSDPPTAAPAPAATAAPAPTPEPQASAPAAAPPAGAAASGDASMRAAGAAATFSSRRRRTAPPAAAPAAETSKTAPAASPAAPPATPSAAAPSAPAASKPTATPAVAAPAPKAAQPAAPPVAAPPPAAAPAVAPPAVARRDLTAPSPAPVPAPEADATPTARARLAGLLSRRAARAAGDDAPQATAPAAQPAAPAAPAPEIDVSNMPPRLAAAVLKTSDLPLPADPESEAQRMTVFGARTPTQQQAQQTKAQQTKAQQSILAKPPARVGKPRFLGLILTAVLLLFLAGVAAWASIFVDDGLARFFGRDPDAPALAGAAPGTGPAEETGLATLSLPDMVAPQIGDTSALSTPVEPEAPVTIAALDPSTAGLTGADAAVLEALRDPRTPVQPGTDGAASQDTETRYAVTGIWPEAPPHPDTPTLISLDDVYIGGIDNRALSQDAVAVPTLARLQTDEPLSLQTSPAAPEVTFEFDERGLVRATPEGALSPDGYVVYLGPPPVVPPETPDRSALQPEPEETLSDRLAGYRPRLRPDNLAERAERAELGGLTRSELAALRPRARPEALAVAAAAAAELAAQQAELKEEAEAETELAEAEAEAEQAEPEDNGLATATRRAVAVAPRPKDRPKDAARRAERQLPDPGGNGSRSGDQVASIAPKTVKPQYNTSGSVARQATMTNAIDLRKVNLIGVYGTPSNRRALVRLPSGRYKKVSVGDTIDGGRISAIGDSELRYQKGGRNLVLRIPSG